MLNSFFLNITQQFVSIVINFHIIRSLPYFLWLQKSLQAIQEVS